MNLDVDMVLIAIGFAGVERDHPLYRDGDVTLTDRDTVGVDAYATNRPRLFAAGDCVLGADLIVTAIAQGRECARAVDSFLMGTKSRLPSGDAVRVSHVQLGRP